MTYYLREREREGEKERQKAFWIQSPSSKTDEALCLKTGRSHNLWYAQTTNQSQVGNLIRREREKNTQVESWFKKHKKLLKVIYKISYWVIHIYDACLYMHHGHQVIVMVIPCRLKGYMGTMKPWELLGLRDDRSTILLLTVPSKSPREKA